MTKKILENTSDKDIVDYRIEEVKFDEEGNVLLDKEGLPVRTGRTLEWSIKAGETLEFPGYVADYLMGIYSFLKVTGAQNEPVPTENPIAEKTLTETIKAKPSEGSLNCKYCGAHFKNVKALGLHFAARHESALLE